MSLQLESAFVTAGIVLFALILKDIVLKRKTEKREASRSAREVFLRYSDPLALSAASLLWRLDEILNHKGRGAYLLVDTNDNKYSEYKRLSTVYRLLNLLGWIRGFQRELSLLRAQSDDHILHIRLSINSLEKALADGAPVEFKRLEALLDLWGYEGELDEPTRLRLAVSLDKILKNELHTQNVLLARDLTKDRQYELSNNLAKVLSSELKIEPPSEDVVGEMAAEASQCLSYREAWIYRDWQAGLGDLMLTEIDNRHRKFEVIGFAEFEYMSLIGPNDDNRWIERANSIFEDLDTTDPNRYDERYNQLRATFLATAQLLLTLSKTDPHQRVLMKKSIELAEKFTKSAKVPQMAKDTRLKSTQPNKRVDSDAVMEISPISAQQLQPQQPS